MLIRGNGWLGNEEMKTIWPGVALWRERQCGTFQALLHVLEEFNSVTRAVRKVNGALVLALRRAPWETRHKSFYSAGNSRHHGMVCLIEQLIVIMRRSVRSVRCCDLCYPSQHTLLSLFPHYALKARLRCRVAIESSSGRHSWLFLFIMFIEEMNMLVILITRGKEWVPEHSNSRAIRSVGLVRSTRRLESVFMRNFLKVMVKGFSLKAR